jgi:hypothetical protein
MKRLISTLAVMLVLALVHTAAAQVSVMESSDGKRTVISEFPHSVVNKMMVRALGQVDAEDNVQWALLLSGTGGTENVQITLDGETVEPTRITTNPDAPGGRTHIYLEQEDFLRLAARTASPEVTVDGTTFTLPDAVRSDMRTIHSRTL